MTENKASDEINMNSTVFVKNLNFTTTEEQLLTVFEKFKIGKVKSAKVVRRKDT